MPPYQSHEVRVSGVVNEISLLIDSDLRLTWSQGFSVAVGGLPVGATVQSDILLHLLPANEGDNMLGKRQTGGNTFTSHTIRNGIAGVSQDIFHDTDIGSLFQTAQVVPGLFQVVITVTGVSTTDSFIFSRWSGVYLIASQSLSNDIRFQLGSMCTVPDQLNTTQLPACPLTMSQAMLFNSGFDEEVVVSDLEVMYRDQYYSYFHPSSSVCYIQQQPLVGQR